MVVNLDTPNVANEGIDVSTGFLDVISQGEVDYEEIIDNNEHGEIIGNCKWFNKKLGYGFITVYTGPRRGVNIFVHHTGIKPLNSNFRTLRKGEYVHFNIIDGQNGLQATDVTGIMGGPLMCDNVESRRPSFDSARARNEYGGENGVRRSTPKEPNGKYHSDESDGSEETGIDMNVILAQTSKYPHMPDMHNYRVNAAA